MTKQLTTTLGVMLGISMMHGGAVRAQGPNEDDPLQWIVDNGFTSIQFMQRCASVGGDGSEITTAPLPVGAGRKLVCQTYSALEHDVTEVQANDGKVYCVLGTLSTSNVGGDDRLVLALVDDGKCGPASIEGSAREPLTISPVSAFGGQAWPVWITSAYDTQDVVPDPGDGRSCRQLFAQTRQ